MNGGCHHPLSTMKYIRTESGFSCPECDFVSERQNTMFYHMKKHTGDKTHICPEPGCGMAFVQKSGLTQHRLIHGTSEGLTCPCCDHTSKTKANLLIHIGRKHGEDWIPPMKDGICTGCNKACASVTAYCYHAVQCYRTAGPEEIRDYLETM